MTCILQDYYDVIQSPIDLATINNHLQCNGYEDPNMVLADVRLIFSNSKLYNINKKSRVSCLATRHSSKYSGNGLVWIDA